MMNNARDFNPSAGRFGAAPLSPPILTFAEDSPFGLCEDLAQLIENDGRLILVETVSLSDIILECFY